MERLYCIIRKDLTHGQKTAQACHAATQYLLDHPDTSWDNGYIICLEIDNEIKLQELKSKLEVLGKKHSYFIEPDMNDSLTSISALDCGRNFRDLRLLR